MLATSSTSFPGAAALRTPLQPKHDIHERELTFVTQNLFANEEASPHHRARAFASFLLQTRPQFAAVQELMPWNAQILLESPVLRKLYPHAAADLLGYDALGADDQATLDALFARFHDANDDAFPPPEARGVLRAPQQPARRAEARARRQHIARLHPVAGG